MSDALVSDMNQRERERFADGFEKGAELLSECAKALREDNLRAVLPSFMLVALSLPGQMGEFMKVVAGFQVVDTSDLDGPLPETKDTPDV